MLNKIPKLETVVRGNSPSIIGNGKTFLNVKSTLSNQVDIWMSGDKENPWISGFAVMKDSQVILCDWNNIKIKILSKKNTSQKVFPLETENTQSHEKKFRLNDNVDLNSWPFDVSVVSNSNVIKTIPEDNKLQYINISQSWKMDMISCWTRCAEE